MNNAWAFMGEHPIVTLFAISIICSTVITLVRGRAASGDE